MSMFASAGERKATALFAAPVEASLDTEKVASTIQTNFERYIVNTITDPARNIDFIEYQVDEGEHFFIGRSGQLVRLIVSLTLDKSTGTAEVTMRATKGNRDALADIDWGSHGEDVGNSLLVARAFHVGLFALRQGGITALVNHPFDARVRARYLAMGFVEGERIDLKHAQSVVRPFEFIAEIYAQHGLDLDEVPP